MTPYAEVIGDPIAQSASPIIHKFWLKKLGIAGDYRTCHVSNTGLAAYFEQRRNDPAWRGCNVTIPHKINVFDYIADPGDVRGTIGAANTVIHNSDGSLIATNTDAAGFFAPIADIDLDDQPVIVVGTGGAAHAVLFALSKARVELVTIVARNPLKAAALLSRFGLRGTVQTLDKTLPPAALLVNATQLGMTGQASLVFDLSPLCHDAIVYDLVYKPRETKLLAVAKARGLATIGGVEMLIGQAALAFELFFGVAPPRADDAELRRMLTS